MGSDPEDKSIKRIGDFLISGDVLVKYVGERPYGIRTPENIRVIGKSAFQSGLTDLYISDGVEVIEWYALGNCIWISNLRLPDSLKKVENLREDSSDPDLYTISLAHMVSKNPVKPVITCSEAIKDMLLAGYTEEGKRFLEERIIWR